MLSADAVSAVNQTTVTSSPAPSTGRRNASSHLPFTPGPPPSFKLSTNGFSATRTTSDVVPSTQSSQRAIQIITSGIPPLLRSSTASGYRQLTSPPVSIAGGEVIHCQVKLANGYHETLNASGSARRVYGRELGAGIARLCQVDDTRISDVNVVEDPDTGASWLSAHRVTSSNVIRPCVSQNTRHFVIFIYTNVVTT